MGGADKIIFLIIVLQISVCPSVVFGDESVDESSFDRFVGERNVTFQNGSSYSGQWRDGVMEGKGVLLLANGDIYRSH